MTLPRYNKLTQKELDDMMNNPNCMLSHKMIIEGRLRRGEWVIIDENGKADEEIQKKIQDMETAKRTTEEKRMSAASDRKTQEEEDCEVF